VPLAVVNVTVSLVLGTLTVDVMLLRTLVVVSVMLPV
jgi:hypothetical protein